MIYEANEPSSACRLWRICKVETSTPPNAERQYIRLIPRQSQLNCMVNCPMDSMKSMVQYCATLPLRFGSKLSYVIYRRIGRTFTEWPCADITGNPLMIVNEMENSVMRDVTLAGNGPAIVHGSARAGRLLPGRIAKPPKK